MTWASVSPVAGGDFVPQTEGVLLHSSNKNRSFIRERRRNDQQEIERERNQLTRYVSVKQVGEGRYARQELITSIQPSICASSYP